jgi:hypothetical protein
MQKLFQKLVYVVILFFICNNNSTSEDNEKSGNIMIVSCINLYDAPDDQESRNDCDTILFQDFFIPNKINELLETVSSVDSQIINNYFYVKCIVNNYNSIDTVVITNFKYFQINSKIYPINDTLTEYILRSVPNDDWVIINMYRKK